VFQLDDAILTGVIISSLLDVMGSDMILLRVRKANGFTPAAGATSKVNVGAVSWLRCDILTSAPRDLLVGLSLLQTITETLFLIVN